MLQFVKTASVAAVFVMMPALSVQAQASREDSVAITRLVADTVIKIGAAGGMTSFGVMTADDLRDRYAHQAADVAQFLVSALQERLGSSLQTIFSGTRARPVSKIPPSVTEVWSLAGASITRDSASIVVNTMIFERKAKCTWNAMDAIYRLRRYSQGWRIVSIVPDTFMDGICTPP